MLRKSFPCVKSQPARSAAKEAEEAVVCPHCGSNDCFEFVDPVSGSEVICHECMRWTLADLN